MTAQIRPSLGLVPMVEVNPLKWLGGKAQETLADGFTSMMMAVWSAAMWLLKMVFGILDNFTPNVEDPDLAKLYGVTLWISLAIALLIAFGQIGLSVLRGDGRGFGTLAAGVVQYGVVVGSWVGVCAALIVGTSGLTDGILQTLLGVDSFSGYAAGDGFVDTVSGTVQATTLGLTAFFVLVPAAFCHLGIQLVRAAALLFLTATFPVAAAGALSEGTKSWMWRSIRWFLACCLLEPMMALALGVATQFAWAGMPDGNAATGSSSAENIGMSVAGAGILLVVSVVPMALFRLLAFVDPGTASGASFRSTMTANEGVAGLLRGRGPQRGAAPQTQGSGSAAASEVGSDGRTSAESGAEAATAARWRQGRLATAGGKVGNVVAAGMTKTGQLAQTSASLGVDVLGQSGVGSQGFYDTSYTHGQRAPRRRVYRAGPDHDEAGAANDVPIETHDAGDGGE